MFRSSQIITATKLVKRFAQIAREMKMYPQALLITQRNGQNFVFVNAEIFEELLARNMRSDHEPDQFTL